MLIADLLLLVLSVVIARAFWRLVDGVIVERTGALGRPAARRDERPTGRGVQMVRDPVCGTFVVPDRALMLDRRTASRVFFCSDHLPR